MSSIFRRAITVAAAAAFAVSGVAVGTTPAAAADPVPGDVQPHYIGGTPPTQNYPAGAYVSLQYNAPDHNRFDWHTCGATLVFANTIVTSAHCVTDQPAQLDAAVAAMFAGFPDLQTKAAPIPTEDKQFFVRAGSQNRTDGLMANAKVVWVDPEWDWMTGPNPVNDIAVLKLDRSLDLQTVPLAPGPVRPNTQVYALGWGLVNPDWSGGLPTMIQELKTKTLPVARCATAGIAARDICLDNPNGTDGSCSGDSGGPALAFIDGAWRLVGNTSRFYGPNWCGESPTVYTSSPEFRTEIYKAARGVTELPTLKYTKEPLVPVP